VWIERGPRALGRRAHGAVPERRYEPHELVLATFAPGKGVRDVDGWIEGGYQGEPPVTFLGGMQTIPSGESVFLTIDLEPGVEYTAVDFSTNSRMTFTVS